MNAAVDAVVAVCDPSALPLSLSLSSSSFFHAPAEPVFSVFERKPRFFCVVANHLITATPAASSTGLYEVKINQTGCPINNI